MQKLTKRLPSPAMVVACIALTIALGGTAWAATLPRNSVGTAQLKRNAVTSIKVRNNSLTGADIRESRLGTVPRAARAGTANSATSASTATTANSATTATSAASAPVSRLDYRSSAQAAIPAGLGNFVRASINCDGNMVATGGGAKVSNPSIAFINDSNPLGKAGWEATASADTAGANLMVFVICAQAATTTP
jgi:hypothetical protein